VFECGRMLWEFSMSLIVVNVGRHAAPTAIGGDRDPVRSVERGSGEGEWVMQREHRRRVLGPRRHADDHVEIAWIVLRARRIDQLAKTADIKARTADVFRRRTAAASHLATRNDYKVIVNCVYPLEVIAGQLADVVRKVIEKGEHE
jgi:hypothetical protein